MNWANILALAGGISGAGFLAFVAYRLGRISVLKEQAVKDVEKKDEMLEATTNYSGAVDKLQRGNF